MVISNWTSRRHWHPSLPLFIHQFLRSEISCALQIKRGGPSIPITTTRERPQQHCLWYPNGKETLFTGFTVNRAPFPLILCWTTKDPLNSRRAPPLSRGLHLPHFRVSSSLNLNLLTVNLDAEVGPNEMKLLSRRVPPRNNYISYSK